jgi:hypothetical protein
MALEEFGSVLFGACIVSCDLGGDTPRLLDGPLCFPSRSLSMLLPVTPAPTPTPTPVLSSASDWYVSATLSSAATYTS